MSNPVEDNLELIRIFSDAFKGSNHNDMYDCMDRDFRYKCHIAQIDNRNDFFTLLKSLDNNYLMTIFSIDYDKNTDVFNVDYKYSYLSGEKNQNIDLKAHATITIKNNKLTKLYVIYENNEVAEKIYKALLLDPVE